MVAYNIMKMLCFISLLCLLAPAQGQTIYKIVDAEGNVSYTSTRPNDENDVQIIDAPREPSQKEIDAARQRQADVEQSVQQLEARKKAKELEKTKQRKKAEKTLQQTIDNNSAIPGLLF